MYVHSWTGLKETMEDGYINKNNQKCCGHSGNPGNHGNQLAYSMKCLVAGCGFVYDANVCDVWQVKCGRCQGGRPGSVRERAST